VIIHIKNLTTDINFKTSSPQASWRLWSFKISTACGRHRRSPEQFVWR